MTVTCKACNNEVDVNMFFSNAKIIHRHEPFTEFDAGYPVATCFGKTICPQCGAEIYRTFEQGISYEDIIKIATKQVKLS